MGLGSGRRAAVAFLFLLTLAHPLDARLGGGQGYQSGSSGSRSNSGSRSSHSAGRSPGSSGWSTRSSSPSSAGRPWWLGKPTALENAVVGGITVVVLLGTMLFFLAAGGLVLSELVKGVRADGLGLVPAGAATGLGSLLARPEAVDPNFSWVLFLDFVHLLFVQVQLARGSKAWEPLRPYLDKALRDSLGREDEGLVEVRDVIVGGISLRRLNLLPAEQTVELAIRFNYTALDGAGRARSFALTEYWTLRRATGALSPPPERARILGCPSCGAPVELAPDGRCVHCDKPQTGPAWGWKLAARGLGRVESLEPLRPEPVALEAGSTAPTRIDPGLAAAARKLQDRHPGFAMEAFRARAERIFLALQAAWSRQDEAGLRPYETDRLYAAHRFWIERFRAAGLANRLSEVVVEGVEPVRIGLDAFYEAITVRIRARMKDGTFDAAGKLVGGSDSVARTFSEYWTLVRRAGLDDAADKPIEECPSCGAPLAGINQAGICGHCGAKVVTGDFGWVLALIEQDEEYAP